MSVESALWRGLVPAVLADIGFRLFVNRVIVSNEGRLLAGLVIAKRAGEGLVVEVDDFVVNLQGLVGLELLAASLADVDL